MSYSAILPPLFSCGSIHSLHLLSGCFGGISKKEKQREREINEVIWRYVIDGHVSMSRAHMQRLVSSTSELLPFFAQNLLAALRSQAGAFLLFW